MSAREMFFRCQRDSRVWFIEQNNISANARDACIRRFVFRDTMKMLHGSEIDVRICSSSDHGNIRVCLFCGRTKKS